MASLVRTILIVTAASAFAGAIPAGAGDRFNGREFYSGDELYTWCRSASAEARTACDIYVCAAVDTWTTDDLHGHSAPYRICLRGRVSCSQASAAVLKYLEEHPANRQVPAAEVAGYALQQAFACP